MKFFFDNCISPRYAAVLRALGEDVVHLRDHFPSNIADEHWIPAVAKEGWVAVSFDGRILRTPHIAQVLEQVGLVAFFLPSNVENRRLHDQAAWLCAKWVAIRECAENRRPTDPLVYIVQENGKVLSLDERHAKKSKKR